MNYSLDASSILQDDPIVLSSKDNNGVISGHGKSNIILPAASKEFLNHQERQERQERYLKE